MRFEIDSGPLELGFPFVTVRTQCVDVSGIMDKNQNIHKVKTINYINAKYLNLFISLLFCLALGKFIKRIKNLFFRNTFVGYVCINLLILALVGWSNIENSQEENLILSAKETEELISGRVIPLTEETNSLKQLINDSDSPEETEISEGIFEIVGYFLFPILILLFFPLCLSLISSYCTDMLISPFNLCRGLILSENEIFNYWVRALVDSIIFMAVFLVASAFLFYILKFLFESVVNKFNKIKPYVD
ncbi:hypothetical protein [Leptospira saintgironsiae]|nr:hypothetical protein [Leptospira saintgironsiae]